MILMTPQIRVHNQYTTSETRKSKSCHVFLLLSVIICQSSLPRCLNTYTSVVSLARWRRPALRPPATTHVRGCVHALKRVVPASRAVGAAGFSNKTVCTLARRAFQGQARLWQVYWWSILGNRACQRYCALPFGEKCRRFFNN